MTIFPLDVRNFILREAAVTREDRHKPLSTLKIGRIKAIVAPALHLPSRGLIAGHTLIHGGKQPL
jgi:hypothetical protein